MQRSQNFRCELMKHNMECCFCLTKLELPFDRDGVLLTVLLTTHVDRK